MSHISRIKTRMVEKEYILAALQDLGYHFEEGPRKITGFGQQSAPVQIRVKPRLIGNEIGLHQAGDAWEIVADWWGVIGTNRKEFTEKLAQRYAYHATKAQLAQQGFDLVGEETSEDGQIRLVLRRMA